MKSEQKETLKINVIVETPHWLREHFREEGREEIFDKIRKEIEICQRQLKSNIDNVIKKMVKDRIEVLEWVIKDET